MLDCNSKKLGGARLAYLDVLKCFGIILVIIGHVQQMGFGLTVYESTTSLMIYTFNMPLFFFISGFLAYKVNLDKKGVLLNLKKKFLYVLLPGVLFYYIYILYNHVGFSRLLEYGFEKYWFTFTLFECFLVYYFVMAVFKNSLLRLLVMLAISIAGIIYLALFSKYEIALLDINRFSKYFHFFFAGWVAKMYYEKYESFIQNKWVVLCSTSLFILLLISLSYQFIPAPIHHFLRDIVLRYLGTIVVISCFFKNRDSFDNDNIINKGMSYVGRYSLPIYLLQYFFLPDFIHYSSIPINIDMVTMMIICIIYTAFILMFCIGFIAILSNSIILKKYLLGQK